MASTSGVNVAARPVVGDGLLNVKKAAGWTSHDVVAKLRNLLRGPRVGHAGTLDPAATGVLPVLIGRGTRIAEYLVDWDKEYRAVLRLGEATDTQDATGAVLSRSPTAGLTQEAIRTVIERFRGRLTQVPPMYSAVKVRGVPLYKVARAGRTVEREPREVTIHDIEVLGIDGRDVSLRVVCSKGTYVRTLCADIGEALGVGGHLASLERRRVGRFGLEQALSLDELASLAERGATETRLYTLAAALADLPALHIDCDAVEGLRHGMAVPVSQVVSSEGAWTAGAFVRLLSPDGGLVGIGKTPCSVEELKQGQPGTMIKLEKVLA